MKLSAHLSLYEMVRSETALRHGIENHPPLEAVENMKRLAVTVFEPIRALLWVKMHVSSGYRSYALNKIVKGSKTSAHMWGGAVDFVPEMDKMDAFRQIRDSDIPFDQLIEECGRDGWIHVGIAREGQTPRREVLYARGSPGNWIYTAEPPKKAA